ncbi:hypothetical protein HN51_056759 [Arachis hypogaea]
MVRLWKEMEYTGYQGQGDSDSYGEELGRLVFLLWAILATLSLFAVIILFCADGVPKKSSRADAANYGNGSACTTGCGGTGCGAGCGAGCGG